MSLLTSPTAPAHPDACPPTEVTNVAAGESHCNGTAGAPETKPADKPAASTTTDRAEAMVDQLGTHLASMFSWMGTKLQVASAHVRASLDEFWTEAQDVRHRNRP